MAGGQTNRFFRNFVSHPVIVLGQLSRDRTDWALRSAEITAELRSGVGAKWR